MNSGRAGGHGSARPDRLARRGAALRHQVVQPLPFQDQQVIVATRGETVAGIEGTGVGVFAVQHQGQERRLPAAGVGDHLGQKRAAQAQTAGRGPDEDVLQHDAGPAAQRREIG